MNSLTKLKLIVNFQKRGHNSAPFMENSGETGQIKVRKIIMLHQVNQHIIISELTRSTI